MEQQEQIATKHLQEEIAALRRENLGLAERLAASENSSAELAEVVATKNARIDDLEAANLVLQNTIAEHEELISEVIEHDARPLKRDFDEYLEIESEIWASGPSV